MNGRKLQGTQNDALAVSRYRDGEGRERSKWRRKREREREGRKKKTKQVHKDEGRTEEEGVGCDVNGKGSDAQ
jgi:hypothetical protein